MLNKIKYITILLFTITANSSYAKDEKKVELKWRKVPEASYYLLEIKDKEEKIVKSIKTRNSSIDLYLEPGEYKKRLTIFNKLEEIDTRSDWGSLNVIKVYEPELEHPKNVIVKKGQKNVPILLKGKHFEKDMEVFFQSKDYRIFVKDTIVKSESEVEIQKDLSELPNGIYQLKLKNPHSKEVAYPNFLTIEKADIIEITPPPPSSPSQNTISKSEDWDIIIRSALLPGWGQFYAGSKYKSNFHKYRGIFYGSLFALTSLYMLKSYSDFSDKKENFQTSAESFVLRTYVNPAELKKVIILDGTYQLQKGNNELKEAKQQYQKVSYFLAGIYIVQLIDAIVLQKKYKAPYNLSKGFHFDVRYTRIPLSSKTVLENQYNLYYNLYF